MPSWNEILEEINTLPGQIDLTRRKYLEQLSEFTGRNTILYYSGWLQKGQFSQQGYRFDIFDGDMSAVKGLEKSKGLDIILHTPGGNIGATESIVNYLQSIFGNNIRAIIPQIAMSAGTMIALSTKQIILGKHSSLGPIDPQIYGIPAHGILEEFNEAKNEIIQNPRTSEAWAPILTKYQPTLIGEAKKAIKWSETLVEGWLQNNMFKSEHNPNFNVKNIIQKIGSHSNTLSHDRHLNLDFLKSELKLNIFELESDKELQDKVLSVHHSTMITLNHTKAYKIIENNLGRAIVQIIN